MNRRKPVVYYQPVEKTFYLFITGNMSPQLSSEYTTRSAADVLLLTHIATIERTKPELPVSSDSMVDI
jgi:hypothetical protein